LIDGHSPIFFPIYLIWRGSNLDQFSSGFTEAAFNEDQPVRGIVALTDRDSDRVRSPWQRRWSR
jgi:hypothetical protein